jgi:hypothetical protein
MTLADFADFAEVVGALGVIASLIFVGVQLNQQTKQLRRAEANIAMQQGSALRHLFLANREVTDLIIAGISGGTLDVSDEFRMNAFFAEATYMAVHVWDRQQHGMTTINDFETAVVPVLRPVMTSGRGVAWWARSKGQFPQEFVALFEAQMPELVPPPPVPSARAVEPAETGVARPGDAG